jgi:ABC-type branched-subunit amino acid transport system substrate-binding protein/predicted negative regulator of RcsB-dependent stress response
MTLSLLIGFGGAAPAGPPALPNKAEEQAKAQIERAKKSLADGKKEPAVETLQKLIETAPQSQYVPEAYLLLGQTLTDMGNMEEAGAYFRRLVEEYPASEFAPQARLGLAAVLMTTGQPDAAVPLLIEAKNQAMDAAAKLAALRQLEDAYLAKPDHVRAVESAVEARALALEEDRPLIENRVRDLIKARIGEQDLRRLADRYHAAFPADTALLRLLELQVAAGEDFKVTRTARDFLARFPKHEQVGTVSAALSALRKKLKAKAALIGALLPLSGPMSPYGTQVLNGMKVALDQAAEANPSSAVGLVAKDTEGDPKQLALELNDLLGEYRPLAVIGPLLSREVKAVAASADSHEVVFVTPTATLPDVQRFSRYLFNTAVNNRALVRELAGHATGAMGWKRFAILAPHDAYGAEMTQIFSEEIRRLGGEIIAAETYAPDDTDFGAPINRIKDADLRRGGKLETAEKKGKELKIYVPGFDAIFLPGDAEKVGLIPGQVQFYAATVPIIGTNGMNSSELIRVGARSVEGALFADSFFVDSPDPAVRNFVERYMKRFQEPPSAFAAQAYESARLVLDAIHKGATTGRALRDTLKNVRHAPGFVGPLTMSPAGSLERRYALIQVTGGKFVPAGNTP